MMELPRIDAARTEPGRGGMPSHMLSQPRAEPPPPPMTPPANVEPPARLDVAPPPPPEPPPRPPPADPETIDLATCAAIAADLARPSVDRAEVLAERGLDDASWARVDRRWKQAIDQDARKGSTALLEAYDDAFLAALARRTDRSIGVAEYARITLSQKRGDLADVLEELSFPRIELLRLTRVWTRRTKADPALAGELKAAVEVEERKK